MLYNKISWSFLQPLFPGRIGQAVFFFTAKWQLSRIPIGVCHVCLYIIDIVCINKAIWLSVVTNMGDAKKHTHHFKGIWHKSSVFDERNHHRPWKIIGFWGYPVFRGLPKWSVAFRLMFPSRQRGTPLKYVLPRSTCSPSLDNMIPVKPFAYSD